MSLDCDSGQAPETFEAVVEFEVDQFEESPTHEETDPPLPDSNHGSATPSPGPQLAPQIDDSVQEESVAEEPTRHEPSPPAPRPMESGPQPGASLPSYPLPFPPFFSNPFMAPYMPQAVNMMAQAASPPLEAQSAYGAESELPKAVSPDHNYRFNPYAAPPGGFYLSPSQYQEMMQGYLQGLLQAAGFPAPGQRPVGPLGMSPVSEPGELVYDDTADAAEALARVKLAEGGRHMPQLPFPYYNMGAQMVTPPPVPKEMSPETSQSSATQRLETEQGNSQQQTLAMASPATSVSSSRADSLMPSLENSPARPGQQERLPQLEDGLSSQSDSEAEPKPRAPDNPTAVLIKKQMHEIDKEINRRIANKNVLKVDHKELEALLCEKRQHEEELARFQEERMRKHQTNGTESAIPWSAADQSDPKEQFTSPKDDRSLDQLSSAQPQQTQFYQPHFPQAAMTAAAAYQQQPAMYPVGAPLAPTPPMAPGTALPPHYAAALLQQMQAARAPAPRMPPGPQPWMNGGERIPAAPGGWLQQEYPPPPPPIPDHQPTSSWADANGFVPSNNQQQETPTNEQNNEATNNQEPVWVMRQSYLDKLKREEERSRRKERNEEVAALEQADREAADSDTDSETNRLLGDLRNGATGADGANRGANKPKKKEVMVHEPAVLIEGVLFRAKYLGSTQLICEGRPTKATRMMQAQEAVTRIKPSDGDTQPSTDVDLFISTEKIMILNTDLQRISDTDVRQDIMMDHPLRTISYIADIGDVVVLMARRVTQSSSPDECPEPSIRRTPKIICHLFESDEAQFIAQSIGQAFQVAYIEFLRANGIDDPGYLREIDYQEVLNSQEIYGDELEMFSSKDMQKDVVVPKQKGEPLGVVVVESGWGSMLPTVVVANLMPTGPAARSNALNIGDQIICVNGISLVGLPLSACQTNIKNTKTATVVKLTVVSTPPVVEVRIKRPDSKYQLGFSVQNGVICSLLRGGIAERGGVRVGHRIIEINGQSVVAVAHEKIVNMLATAVGEIQMKTMPTSMFRLLTGQEQPNYI